ncbi:MAG: hypothetical protein FWF47_06800 [Clostridia bacterium]|nr:hypothetical protein [Clostridia bacterium]
MEEKLKLLKEAGFTEFERDMKYCSRGGSVLFSQSYIEQSSLEQLKAAIESVPDTIAVKYPCYPICDFCIHAGEPVPEDDEDADGDVMCHIKGELVFLSDSCEEHFKCRYCDNESNKDTRKPL